MSNTTFRWRDIAVAAFGPSLLFSIGEGAILPVIALSARDRGASVALSGLVVSLVGFGSLLSNIPAAAVIARHGERKAMLGAIAISVAGLVVCLLANALALFAVGIFALGAATSVLLLARQTYLIEATPAPMRARAMSSLGGTRRIGVFVGPFIGAGAIHLIGLRGAYEVAIVAMLACGALVYTIPDLESPRPDAADAHAGSGLVELLHRYRKTFATLGFGILLVQGIRTCRQIIIPLWGSHLGIDPAMISVIYGLSALIDMLAFYPSGAVMDRYGRRWAAIPSMSIIGAAMVVLPATAGIDGFLIVSLGMGLGNGLGSGLVMTIGADASPSQGRVQFLGLWRLFSDIGAGLIPLSLSAMIGAASLAPAIIVTGSLGFVAAAVFARWLPHPASAEVSRHRAVTDRRG